MEQFGRRLSLQIFASLALGIVTGITFGEDTNILEPISTGFVMLLQMPVITYLICSIITGISQFTLAEGKQIVRSGTKYVIIFWSIVLSTCFLLPLGFPKANPTTLFSSSSEIDAEQFRLLDIFIPANPFEALAKGIVPAIVVFSVLIGVALLRLTNRRVLTDIFFVIQDASLIITRWVANISPIGAFALTAVFAGSVTPFQMGTIKYYFVALILAILILTFWVLPNLVASLTPLKYKEFVGPLRPALLLALSSGSTLIVLPLVSIALRSSIADLRGQTDTKRVANLLVPIIYNFPLTSPVLTIIFILFTSWYYAMPLSIFQNMYLAIIGVFNGFGEPTSSIPFLLSQMKLPLDAFDMYVPTTVIANRLYRLLSVMSIASFSLLTSSALHGLTRINLNKLLSTILVTLLLLGSSLLGLRFLLHPSDTDRKLFSQFDIEQKAQSIIKENPQNYTKNKDTLSRIVETGIIRVGYNPEAMPFSYFNEAGQLVGFDIAMAHKLALDINATIEFIPFTYSSLGADLEVGRFDIAMSAVTINEPRLSKMRFTNPYLENELAFLTKDYLKYQFLDLGRVKSSPSLKIAVLKGSSHEILAKSLFKKENLIAIEQYSDFLNINADALLWSLQEARAFAMTHPIYTPVAILPAIGKESLSYAVARNELEFLAYMNEWLILQKANGFIDRQYNHFVLAQTNSPKKRRWSIARDVLKLWPYSSTGDTQ